MEFKLTSNEQHDDIFYSWINGSADGLGFLLDFPIYASYSTTFEEITQHALSINKDSQIDFDFIAHTMEYSQVAGHYVDVDTPKKISFSTIQIKNFVNKLRDNKLLSGATGYYLKSIEEPEFFLASLYKAYELIKNTGSVSKSDAKKFTRLANDDKIINSRHTSKQASEIHSLSKEERNYCKEFIRNGIFKLAGNL